MKSEIESDESKEDDDIPILEGESKERIEMKKLYRL